MNRAAIRYSSAAAAPGGLVRAGEIVAPHGVRGAIRVRCYLDSMARPGTRTTLHDATGQQAITLNVAALTGRQTLICHIDGVTNRTQAGRLCGQNLYLAREVLPPVDKGDYYIEDLLSLEVHSPQGEVLGRVIALLDAGNNPVIEYAAPDGGVHTHVFSHDNFPEVCLAGGYMVFAGGAN